MYFNYYNNSVIKTLKGSGMMLVITSDLVIPRLVTNGIAKICCHGLILALFYSTMVIKNDFG